MTPQSSSARRALPTGCLLGLALLAALVAVTVDAAERAWVWLDGQAERILQRFTGKVVATFDPQRRCDNCRQPLTEHCTRHVVPCCPGACPRVLP